MNFPDEAIAFRYPTYLRYWLRGSVPAIAVALFLFSLSHGWDSDQIVFGWLCAAAGAAWWWAFRRYSLTIILGKDAIQFRRGRAVVSVPWSELTAVRFSTSGVRITANGRTWRVVSGLSGWAEFERLLRDQASAQALAAWLTPPFTVRTKWRAFLQPGLVCLAFLIGGINRMAAGEWQAGLVMLGVAALFAFLLRGGVLWYRFDQDALVVQRLAGRERHPWNGLQFATVRQAIVGMSFADGALVNIDGSQITRSPEEIFLSMQDFWTKLPPGCPVRAEPGKSAWSWPAAAFWWTIVPALALVTFPAVIAGIRAKIGALADVCQNVPAPDGPCRTLRNVSELLRLDIAVLILMFLAVAGFHWQGEYCNRHRDKLLKLFRPAFVMAVAITVAILFIQSALLAGLLYYVPLELASISLPGLLITVGAGLVLGLYQLARHTWSAVRPPPLELDAVPVSRAEQPALWGLAADVASSLSAPAPDNILLGLEANYFVTESRISAHGVSADGYSLYLSVPVTRLMSEPELRAIIGHEFGHFRGADTAFTKRFFPLYNSAAKALAGMANAYGSWTLLPAIYMLHFFLVSFGRVQSAVSREREFIADNAGAEASSPLALASALVKLEVFAPIISALIQERVYTDRTTPPLGERLNFKWPSLAKDSLLNGQTPHPFDSHPPLGSRLQNLKVDLDEILTKPMSHGANQLLQKPDDLEARVIERMREEAKASLLSPNFTFVRGVPLP